jgi:lipopolysaccharide transport system permease protein
MIEHLLSVWRYRYFWSSLVKLDLQNRYRRSYLGIGWSLMHPLVFTIVMCVVFGGILSTGNWRDFAPYMLAAMAIWDYVKSSMVIGCDSFVRAEAYIRQCPLPFTIYSLRTVLGTFIHFVICIALVVVAVGILTEDPMVVWRLISTLPAIVLLSIFAWSCATLAAYAHTYFHDTKHIIDVVTQMMFFLTPIMYKPDLIVSKLGTWVIEMNPIAHFIMIIGIPITSGTMPTLDAYLFPTMCTAMLFSMAVGTSAWLHKKLIFQL